MVDFKRSEENPVLLPSLDNEWETEAVFNGCPIVSKNKTWLLYRAVSSPLPESGRLLNISSIGCAESEDGLHFTNRRQLIKPEFDWERYGCEDPRVTKVGNRFFIFYTAISDYPFKPSGIKIGLAITKDFHEIEEKHLITNFNSKAMAMFPGRVDGKLAAILTANTDSPPARIGLALFDDEEQIWSPEYWEGWHGFLDDHIIPLQRRAIDHIEVGAPPIKTRYGWLLLYSYIQNYFSPPATFGIEAVLLDTDDPRKIIARLDYPLLDPKAVYEMYGKVPGIVFPSGALIKGQKLHLYYGAADTCCATASVNTSALINEMLYSRVSKTRLERFAGNPVLSPIGEHDWESKAVFNPAAVYAGGKVHLLYRAMSHRDVSVMGYAASEDGFNFTERFDQPVYGPRQDFERMGCEDPRLTKLGSHYYVLYTAWDGHLPRIAISSIKEQDFLARNWNWSDPVLISPPNVDDKDAAIFPQMFEGKYAILHRIGKSIWLDLVDDLEFGDGRWLKGNVILSSRREPSTAEKIGISAPPIETDQGWLLLYHVVTMQNGRVCYTASAALLDLKKPWRVLARRKTPLLEPEMPYELEGQVGNVVFPCGAVVIDKRLFVYYGGGDSVVGVASMDLDELIDSLLIEGDLPVSKPAADQPKSPEKTRALPVWTPVEGFIPGIRFTLPSMLISSAGEKISPTAVFQHIKERNRREFAEFAEKDLNLSPSAGLLEVTAAVRDALIRAEKVIDAELLPGDITTLKGTEQVAREIFEVMSRRDMFALTLETVQTILDLFPPSNLLIRNDVQSVAELEKIYDPRDILALSDITEEKEYTDRIWDWIWDNAKPEHFGTVSPGTLVVDSDTYPSLMDMKESSSLSRLAARIVMCNLRPGIGGDFPKLRYLTTVSKNIIEAEQFGDIWQTFARRSRGLGKKIINSLEGHWGKEPLSAHNIFENRHQRILVERLRNLANRQPEESPLAKSLRYIIKSYHLSNTFDDGRFVPCSAWTWASYSFKGGRGIPSPLSLHVERDWYSRDLILEMFRRSGGTEQELDDDIIGLMADELESENIIEMLFAGIS